MTNLTIVTQILIDHYSINIGDLFKEGSIEKEIVDFNSNESNPNKLFQVLIPISDFKKSIQLAINKVISHRPSNTLFNETSRCATTPIMTRNRSITKLPGQNFEIIG